MQTGVRVRMPEPDAAFLEYELVGHHLESLEARLLQERADVHREPVGGEGDRESVRVRPLDERRERGCELGMFERVGEHLLARAVEHRGLTSGGLAKAHLPPVDRVVEGLPPGVAERVEQHLGHVLQAGGAVEVHEEGPDRQHRLRVPGTVRAPRPADPATGGLGLERIEVDQAARSCDCSMVAASSVTLRDTPENSVRITCQA